MRHKRFVSIILFVIAILFALPIWWRVTAVTKATLPSDFFSSGWEIPLSAKAKEIASNVDDSFPMESLFRFEVSYMTETGNDTTWKSSVPSIASSVRATFDSLHLGFPTDVYTQIIPFVHLNLPVQSFSSSSSSDDLPLPPLSLVNEVMNPSLWLLDSPIMSKLGNEEDDIPAVFGLRCVIVFGSSQPVANEEGGEFEESIISHATIVPRWGGIMILGGKEPNSSMLEYASQQCVRNVRSWVLMQLFTGGISEFDVEELNNNNKTKELLQSVWTSWNIDRTLDSLVALSGSRALPNIELQFQSIQFAVEAKRMASLAKSLLFSNISQAVIASHKSRIAADRAFFDPSANTRSHMPFKHLLAIYAPVAVPLLLPTLFAFRTEWNLLKRKKTKMI